ncbi:hypothetical protein Pmani_035581 [Petrolisthes manimaculis]|uniref:Uncharacterized protein n=1 Tax=Petrolisthes manimaculis TaxID=1843537 RepID=A0AAE1NK77_9EUCA|nr:hypothetical protein Pmani_035581 [Petrolisthes manimaculis]
MKRGKGREKRGKGKNKTHTEGFKRVDKKGDVILELWTPGDTWGRRVTWDVSSTKIITSFYNSPPPSLLPLPTLLTFLTTSTNPPLLQPPLPPTLLSYNPLFHSFTPSSTLSFLTLPPLSPSSTFLSFITLLHSRLPHPSLPPSHHLQYIFLSTLVTSIILTTIILPTTKIHPPSINLPNPPSPSSTLLHPPQPSSILPNPPPSSPTLSYPPPPSPTLVSVGQFSSLA